MTQDTMELTRRINAYAIRVAMLLSRLVLDFASDECRHLVPALELSTGTADGRACRRAAAGCCNSPQLESSQSSAQGVAVERLEERTVVTLGMASNGRERRAPILSPSVY